MRELAKKLGYMSVGSNHKTIKKYLNLHHIDTSHFTGYRRGSEARNVDNVFVENSTANQSVARRWYINGNYTSYKCAICGLEPFWNGMPLVLTLDHINGVNKDHRLSNLIWICPNCDRQLPTFGFKNYKPKYIKSKPRKYCIDCGIEISKGATRCVQCNNENRRVVIHNVSKEKLLETITNNNGNLTQVGKQLDGISSTSVRKLCKYYGLPYHSVDYKKHDLESS